MSAGPVTGELRTVPAAPRGRRFSRPGVSARLMATPRAGSGFSDFESSASAFRAREQRLLAQMDDNWDVTLLVDGLYQEGAARDRGEQTKGVLAGVQGRGGATGGPG